MCAFSFFTCKQGCILCLDVNHLKGYANHHVFTFLPADRALGLITLVPIFFLPVNCLHVNISCAFLSSSDIGHGYYGPETGNWVGESNPGPSKRSQCKGRGSNPGPTKKILCKARGSNPGLTEKIVCMIMHMIAKTIACAIT